MKLAFALLLVLVSFSGLSLAANAAIVYTVYNFLDSQSCLGTNVTQTSFTDFACTAVTGTTSERWELVSARVVNRRFFTTTNGCTGDSSTTSFTNSQCYPLTTTTSLQVRWILLVDVTESTFTSSTSCDGNAANTVSVSSNYCYTSGQTSSSFFVNNFTTGQACTYNQPACPDTNSGSCISVTNGACNQGVLGAGATRYVWATPTPITAVLYPVAGCTGASDNRTFFNGACSTAGATSASANSSIIITINSATQATLGLFSGNDNCTGSPTTTTLGNNQCIAFGTGSAIFVFSDTPATTSTTTTGTTTTGTTTTGTTTVVPATTSTTTTVVPATTSTTTGTTGTTAATTQTSTATTAATSQTSTATTAATSQASTAASVATTQASTAASVATSQASTAASAATSQASTAASAGTSQASTVVAAATASITGTTTNAGPLSAVVSVFSLVACVLLALF